MIKNISNIRVLNTSVMCFFVFVMFFNSVIDLFQEKNFDSIEIVDDIETDKSEKEIDEKTEFEDDFLKTAFTHYFNKTKVEKCRFDKPAVEVSNVNKRIFIPPPQYL